MISLSNVLTESEPDGILKKFTSGFTGAFGGIAGTVIDIGMDLIVSGITDLINAQENAIKKADEALVSLEKRRETLQNSKSTIKDISSEYERLADGVDRFGQNISLSADEYARYNEIANQIAGIFPQMVQGYTAEGNAIIAHKGNVDALTKAYEEQKRAAQEASVASADDVFKGYKAAIGDDWWNIHGAKGAYSKSKPLENIVNNTDSIDDLQVALNEYSSVGDVKNLLNDAGYHVSQYDIKKAGGSAQIIQSDPSKIVSYYHSLVSQINVETAKIKPIALDYVNLTAGNLGYSSEVKNSLQSIVTQLGPEFYNSFNDSDELFSFLSDGLIAKFEGAEGQQLSKTFNDMFQLKDAFEANEIDTGSYLEELGRFKQVFEKLPEEIRKPLQDAFNLDTNSVSIQKMQAALESQVGEEVNSLSLQELQLAYQLVDENDSWETLRQKIDKAKRQSMGLESIFGNLQTSLNEVTQAQSLFTQALQEQNTQGTVSAETISALAELDEDYLKVLEDSNGQMKLNSDNFQKAISDKLKTGKEAAQEELREALLTVQLDGTNAELEEHIAKVASLCDSYDYATSALKQWRDAQSNPDVGDLTSEGQSAFNAIKEGIESGKVGTNEYQSAANLLKITQNGTELTGEAWTDELDSYLKDSEESVTHFLGELEGLGTLSGKIFTFDDVTTISQIAEKLGITEDFAKMLVDNARQYGYELNVQDDSMSTAVAAYQTLLETQKEAQAGNEEAKAQFQKAAEILANMPEEVQTALGITVTSKEDGVKKITTGEGIECELKLDTVEAEEKTAGLGESLEENSSVAVGVEVEPSGLDGARAQMDAFRAQINALPENIRTTYHLEVTENGAIQYFDSQTDKTVTITAETLDAEATEKLNGIINTKTQAETPTQFTVQAITEPAITGLTSVQSMKNLVSRDVHFTVFQHSQTVNDGGGSNKAAQAGGTGITGIPETGSVLVGEEAPEMYVNRKNGRWKLVGVMGAEFIHAEKGDIIFNARQTRNLLNNGFIASRGKSFAKGSDPFLDFGSGRYTSKTDWSKWSMTGSRSVGGTVYLTPKVEDKDVYLADIDELYEAEVRLKELENREDGLEHSLKMTDSLSEQVQLTRHLNENYRQQQAELHAANERRDELIKANVEKLRGAGFNVYYDPVQNRLMIANMEHLNQLMGSTQEETNALRKEFEDMISETEKFNEANQKSSDEWRKRAEDIRKNNLVIVEKTLQGYDDFISYADDFDLWTNMDVSKLDILQDKMEYLNQAFEQGLISVEEYKKQTREIGKDIYKEQKKALEDIIELTEDLIKQETKDRVAALEDQIDKYQEIIDLKKKALQDEADEKDYSKERDQKLKDISKLQAQIARLKLDDSREAAYERMALEEELAEKQQELADFQEDHAREAQIDALDEEAERFKKAKDEEIEATEAAIDTEVKLREKAMARINTGGEQLKNDLIKYAQEYKDSIDGKNSVTSAWNIATEAMEKFGSVAGALQGIKTESTGGKNSSDISSLVAQMRHNSNQYSAADKAGKKQLSDDNLRLGDEINELLSGTGGRVARENGTWYLYDSKGKRLLYSVYHEGGIVGSDLNVRDDEVFALLQNGELVLDRDDKKTVYEAVDFAKSIYDRFGTNISAYSEQFSPLLPQMENQYSRAVREIAGLGDTVFSPTINVEFNHQGGMKESDAVKYGNMIANTALDSLQNMFVKSGISNHRFSGFKQ